MLMVGVSIAQRTLGEDGDVSKDVEECQPGPHICCCPQIVGAEKKINFQIRPYYVFGSNFNLLKTTMNVNRRPTAM